MNSQIKYDSLGGREFIDSSNEQINSDLRPPQFQKSQIIETQLKEYSNLSSGSFNNRCPMSDVKNLFQNVGTILQETIQTDAANLLNSLENQDQSKFKKSSSEFFENKLAQMKQKHKQLQEQLSSVSNYDSVSSVKRKNIIGHSQSTTNVVKNQQSQPSFFNFTNINNQMKQFDNLSNMISNIKINPQNLSTKDIEVIIEKSDSSMVYKNLINQIEMLLQLLNDSNAEKEVLAIKNQSYEKEAYVLKEQNRFLEEDLKRTNGFLSDTQVELERTKTLFDLLQRKYLDLLKKKQEVKIINKETIKEIVVEKPIEIIKELNNIRLVKQKKEVRKIIKPRPDQKHTTLTKLHVVEKQVIEPQIKTIERLIEIPKIEIVEKEKFIDRPVIIERPVDRLVEVPKIINKEVFVDRPVYIEKPIERFIEVPKIIEKERLVDRPVFIEKPVDRIVEKETFIDRPVYISQPAKQTIVDRPVYIREPPIERVVEVEKPVYIDRPVYQEPVQTQLVNSYQSPQRIIHGPIHHHERLVKPGYQQGISKYYNSIQTNSTDLLSPQYSSQLQQQFSC